MLTQVPCNQHLACTCAACTAGHSCTRSLASSLYAGMNVLVCTPGRLLQHMDETPGFDAGQIQALVLDEADRILDMGFSATLNAILQNLPQERQTMLFSATQTKSIKDLARLSLKAPEYIAVHADAAMPTPVKLQQVRHCSIMTLQICMLSARAEAPFWFKSSCQIPRLP